MSNPDAPLPPHVEHARRLLRSCFSAVVSAGERFDPVQLVVDPAVGAPVLRAPRDLFDVDTLSLHLPGDEPGALHVFGTLARADDPADLAADLLLAYHGPPIARTIPWATARLTITHARRADDIIDADALLDPHPWPKAAAALRRELNADPARLTLLLRSGWSISCARPLCVGVDARGMDVRIDLGPVRCEWPTISSAPEHAPAALRATIENLASRTP